MLRPTLLWAVATALSCTAALAEELPARHAAALDVSSAVDDNDVQFGDANAPTATATGREGHSSYFRVSSEQASSASSHVLPEPLITPSSFEQESKAQGSENGCGAGWQHIRLFDESCSPSLCRFDCPPDFSDCVTHDYSPHPCTDCYRGSFHICDKCGDWVTDSCNCDVHGDSEFVNHTAYRFGWWSVTSHGSLTKTGEFQDLNSSPFWDIDTVRSDGTHTLDLIMTGLDNEANDVRGQYFGPLFTGKVNYERFLRRLDHKQLAGADQNGTLLPTDNIVTQDLNVGENYAIRVQQFDAKFKGNITDNIKWRLNVWGMRKTGERQVSTNAHCFDVDPSAVTNNVCHVTAQQQHIDWLTKEIQPAVEAKFENVTLEYSRTIRELDQGDSVVTNQYTHFAPFAGPGNTLGSPWEYGMVPQNLTQIDRVKIGSTLTENNEFYANLYNGDTENFDREMHRRFRGYDVRLTNRSVDGLSVTGYAKFDDQHNNWSPFLLPEEQTATVYSQMKRPNNYTNTLAGIKGAWRPYNSSVTDVSSTGFRESLAWAWGYEYGLINRDFATYPTVLGDFTQLDTISHQIELGPSWRWSPTLSSFVRYKVRFIKDPLTGVRERSGQLNTNQPTQEHRVEIGSSWTPSSNFMTTAQFSVVNSWNRSEFAHFTENNYPVTCTFWYSPVERLSFTGGYAYFSNWINQNITLGFRYNLPDQTETTPWSYGGQANVISFNTAYAWSQQMKLMAGYEFTRGSNLVSVPASPAGADWSALPGIIGTISETQRATAGADWQLHDNMNLYCRYVLFNYNDLSTGLNTGTTHMVMGGVSLIQ